MTGRHRTTPAHPARWSTAVLAVAMAAGLATTGLLAAAPASAAPAPIALTSSRCPADIHKGEIDGCVTRLQQLLDAKGAELAVDGNFGPATFAAVESYQRRHGLAVDGIVGPRTKAALDAATPAPPAPPTGSVLAQVVSHARAIERGAAETGWSGGYVQYVWGGGHHGRPGPSTGTCVGDPQSLSCTNPAAVGTDCSGFTRWVYDLAYGRDVLGSGSTRNQIAEMHRTTSPRPGDLVFFGANPSSTEHVGVYIGNGQMINSYETGTNVQTNSLSAGGHLLGYYHL